MRNVSLSLKSMTLRSFASLDLLVCAYNPLAEDLADLVFHRSTANHRDKELIFDVDVVLRIGDEREVRLLDAVLLAVEEQRPVGHRAQHLDLHRMRLLVEEDARNAHGIVRLRQQIGVSIIALQLFRLKLQIRIARP